MAGASYFKCYPSDFLAGVLGMEADHIAVYTVVLMLIYDRGEPVVEEADTLAWRCRMNTRRFKNVLEHLVSTGKLTRSDGRLTNRRAEEELRSRREASEKQASNASVRWGKEREKPRENNDTQIPPHSDGNAYQIPDTREGKDLTVLCPKRVRTRAAYSEDFEGFWERYPTDSNMSKKEANTAWQKLSPEDRALAVQGLASFLGYCQSNPDYRPVHAVRYLTQRRFDGHANAAKKISATVLVKQHTPQFRAWDSYLVKTTGKRAMVSDKHGGWYFPSEWPPQLHAGEAA